MKIITDNAVYVQLIDIAFLNTTKLHVPKGILEKVFEKDALILDDSNQYEFIKYNKKYIAYFEKLDWIIDLFKISQLNEKELIIYAKEITNELNELKNKFKKMPLHEQFKNRLLLEDIKILDYKYNSIGYILQFIRGNLKIYVPTEVLIKQDEKPKKRRLFKK